MHLITRFALVLALAGCTASSSYDPGAEPAGLGEQITQGKADGAFGATEIQLGDRVTGETGADGLVLFAFDAESGDHVEIIVERTSGDLEPSAYLYRGTEVFVRPDDVQVDDDFVNLAFSIAQTGQHHIVVKARDGRGAGEFSLHLQCSGGPCYGRPTYTGVERAAECINDAARCALDRLPEYGGRVGEVTARNVFSSCLADQGEDCTTVCDEDGELFCDDIVDQLPWFADQPVACHAEMNACLGGCEEIGGYYGAGRIGDSAAALCWSGYNGNCLQYVQGHAACGGDYTEGSVGECRAYCEGTEGAWDEGPWDGCMDHCRDLQSEIDGFIEDVAASVGEYFDETDHDALIAISSADVPDVVMARAQRVVDEYDESLEAEAIARGDHAELSHLAPMAIMRGEERIGYVISVDYYVDHPLFDGAGVRLFLNLEGDIVAETSWTG